MCVIVLHICYLLSRYCVIYDMKQITFCLIENIRTVFTQGLEFLQQLPQSHIHPHILVCLFFKVKSSWKHYFMDFMCLCEENKIKLRINILKSTWKGPNREIHHLAIQGCDNPKGGEAQITTLGVTTLKVEKHKSLP